MAEDTIVIRFAGDSGDGVQVLGEQLTILAAVNGRDVRSQPDFPAEIRAPAGTVAGVSGFQLAMAEKAIFTAGETLDILVALNPAALKQALPYLVPGGLLVINEDNFQDKDWQKAKMSADFLQEVASQYQLIQLPLISLTLAAVKGLDLSQTQAKKTKNFYVLGLVLWLFDLPFEACLNNIQKKYAANPLMVKANALSLKAGYNYAMTLELSRADFILDKMVREPGDYRQITGTEAVGLALAALTVKTGVRMLVSGYPITPASLILQECAKLAEFGVELLQAEDEIAAICACLGAAFGGCLALTCTSGPGFDLKTEGLGLAVMSELPMVLIDVQRAGLSTGLPTKTGQSDLNQALFGRHGEAPLPVIAPRSPLDCFYTIMEAFRLAILHMTPVVVLMDAYLANAAEPWKIPALETLSWPEIVFNRFPKPYQRDERLARSWNIPGTPGFIHQIGGLEKEGEEGRVSYDAENHANMVKMRAEKIARLADDSAVTIEGEPSADILLIGWGSTYGSLISAVEQCQKEGLAIALLHLRHLNPLPSALPNILAKYKTILVAELNSGQLCRVLRAEYLIPACSISQCNGQPFSVHSLIDAIKKESSHDQCHL